MENPGATPAVVLTSTRESFFHEGGELGMFVNGDQTAFQEEVHVGWKEEVRLGWKEEDVIEQATNRDNVDNTLERREEMGEVPEERLMVEVHEERLLTEGGEGVKGREGVIEEREERREGMEEREPADSREEIQERAVVLEDREEGSVHSAIRRDRMKVERSLRSSTQVESQVYEFTFDQCDSDDTQD